MLHVRALLAIALITAVACGGASSPTTPTAAPTSPAAPRSIDTALARRLDPIIDRALAEQQVVGMVVLVARDGKLVYARAGGLADREARRPVREDTMFRLASMTKPIVSIAALALIDQGKLGLDDPVTKYLPDFQPRLADGRAPTITVRQLLTHTSGLSYKFIEKPGSAYHKAEVSDGLAEPGLGMAEFLKRLASVPLVHEPGTSWQYSLSIDVLGAVVERAGDAPLPVLVERLVTRPLGMTDTRFMVSDRARLATPYVAGKPPARMTESHDLALGDVTARFAPSRIFDERSFPSGGAGLAGTAHDYLRFCEAMRLGGAPILKPETARAAMTNQLGTIESAFLGPGSGFGFGFGIVLDPAAAKQASGRGTIGWGGVYGTQFWVDPVAKLSVVILTNVAGEVPLTRDIEQAIYAR